MFEHKLSSDLLKCIILPAKEHRLYFVFGLVGCARVSVSAKWVLGSTGQQVAGTLYPGQLVRPRPSPALAPPLPGATLNYVLCENYIQAAAATAAATSYTRPDPEFNDISQCQLLHRHQRVNSHLQNIHGVLASAANLSIGSTNGCTITEKAPTPGFHI